MNRPEFLAAGDDRCSLAAPGPLLAQDAAPVARSRDVSPRRSTPSSGARERRTRSSKDALFGTTAAPAEKSGGRSSAVRSTASARTPMRTRALVARRRPPDARRAGRVHARTSNGKSAGASTATSSTRRPISTSTRSSATSASPRSGARTTRLLRRIAGISASARSRSSGAKSSGCSLPTSSRRATRASSCCRASTSSAFRSGRRAPNTSPATRTSNSSGFRSRRSTGSASRAPTSTRRRCRRRRRRASPRCSRIRIAPTAISAIRTTAFAPIRSSRDGTSRRSITAASARSRRSIALPTGTPGAAVRVPAALRPDLAGGRHREQGPRRGGAARRGRLRERPGLQRDGPRRCRKAWSSATRSITS